MLIGEIVVSLMAKDCNAAWKCRIPSAMDPKENERNSCGDPTVVRRDSSSEPMKTVFRIKGYCQSFERQAPAAIARETGAA